MNRADAARVLAVRQVLWPHTPAARGEAAKVEVEVWADLFAEVPSERVLGAMRTYRGEAFAPTPGQVEEALNPEPSPDAIFDEFRHRHAQGWATSRADEVPWSSPFVRAIAEAGWFRQWGLSPDPTGDPSLHAAAAAFRAHFRGACVSARRQWNATGEIVAAPRLDLERGLPELPA